MSVKSDLKRALTSIDIATRTAKIALEKAAELNETELHKVLHEIDDAEAYIRRALKSVS